MAVHRNARGAALILLCVVLLSAWALPAGARQNADLNRLHSYFAKVTRDWHMPRMAVAMTEDDAVVFAKRYTVRYMEQGGSVDDNTPFAIASNTGRRRREQGK